MTAREYLLQIRKSNKVILAQYCELQELRAKKDGLKSVELSERVKSSTTYNKSLDDYIQQEAQILAELRDVHHEWWTCREIIKSIENQNYADVLRYYYLLHKEWHDVADIMGISERWIYKLHSKALQEFRKITKLN